MDLMHAAITTLIQLPLLLLLLRSDWNDGSSTLQATMLDGYGCGTRDGFPIDVFLWLCILLAHVEGLRDLMNQNSALVSLCLFLIVAGLFKFKYRQSMSTLGFTHRSLARWVFLLMVGAPFIAAVIIDFKLGTSYLRKVVFSLQDAFGVVVIAPVAEEALARGIVYSPYRKKYGVVVATLVSATLFGTLHLNGPSQFALGIVLAILYEKSQSFTLIAAGHSLFNAASLVASWKFAT